MENDRRNKLETLDTCSQTDESPKWIATEDEGENENKRAGRNDKSNISSKKSLGRSDVDKNTAEGTSFPIDITCSASFGKKQNDEHEGEHEDEDSLDCWVEDSMQSVNTLTSIVELPSSDESDVDSLKDDLNEIASSISIKSNEVLSEPKCIEYSLTSIVELPFSDESNVDSLKDDSNEIASSINAKNNEIVSDSEVTLTSIVEVPSLDESNLDSLNDDLNETALRINTKGNEIVSDLKQTSIVELLFSDESNVDSLNDDLNETASSISTKSNEVVLKEKDSYSRMNMLSNLNHNSRERKKSEFFGSMHFFPKTNDFLLSRVIRRTNLLDITTGVRAPKEFKAQRICSNSEAMNPKERRYRELTGKDVIGGEIHYRLRSVSSSSTGILKLVNFVDNFLYSILDRSLKASFWCIMLSIVAAFYIFVFVWASGFALVTYFINSESILVGGEPKLLPGLHFMDHLMVGFQLSWTTLNTVGYGYVHPKIQSFFLIDVLFALEGFIGLLAAAFCSSIIFGKQARAKSIANVIFSDTLVVQYGTGVLEKDERSDSEESDGRLRRCPCPVLEFQVINRDFDSPAGEIVNAKICLVTRLVASQATDAIEWQQKASQRLEQKKKMAARIKNAKRPPFSNKSRQMSDEGKRNNRVSIRRPRKLFRSNSEDESLYTTQKRPSLLDSYPRKKRRSIGIMELAQQVNQSFIQFGRNSRSSEFDSHTDNQSINYDSDDFIQRNHVGQIAVIEDSSDGEVPPSIFSKVNIETNKHPFFKNVWVIRHVLDAKSPLLSMKAKQKIRRNRGYWPREFCNYTDVRKHIKFDQLVAVLSGTQNASGSVVYGTKIYDYGALNIGFTFVKTLYTNGDGKLSVGLDLINNTVQQEGGGGEPLKFRNEANKANNIGDSFKNLFHRIDSFKKNRRSSPGEF